MKRPRTHYLTLGAAVAAFTALEQIEPAQAKSPLPVCSRADEDCPSGEDAREAELQLRD